MERVLFGKEVFARYIIKMSLLRGLVFLLRQYLNYPVSYRSRSLIIIIVEIDCHVYVIYCYFARKRLKLCENLVIHRVVSKSKYTRVYNTNIVEKKQIIFMLHFLTKSFDVIVLKFRLSFDRPCYRSISFNLFTGISKKKIYILQNYQNKKRKTQTKNRTV